MPNEATKRLQTYDLAARGLELSDIGKLHELSVSVNWPHRPEDWRMLLDLGKGYAACDEIGRVVGSAMWFPMGDDFATIGMVITSPRLQALGAGRWLMKRVLQDCGKRNLLLNATRAAYKLYASLSFEPAAVVQQHQGEARAPSHVLATDGAEVRAIEASDFREIIHLDKAAYGVDREAILKVLLEHSIGTALLREGRIRGFALCRKFGRGHVVGPIVARDAVDAIALTAPHVAAHAGSFLRVDTARGAGGFAEFLSRCGLPEYDTVTTMSRRAQPAQDGGVYSFGLVSQALG